VSNSLANYIEKLDCPHQVEEMSETSFLFALVDIPSPGFLSFSFSAALTNYQLSLLNFLAHSGKFLDPESLS